MLIWIKAPCVAIGVLASFVLLLSTVVSEQVDLNVTSDDLEFTTSSPSESPDIETLQLMSLPFAQSLSNPCSRDGEVSRPAHGNLHGHRVIILQELYRFVSHYASIYKQEVQRMLQNHTITGCSSLHVHNLPYTPTHEELEEMRMDEAWNKIYLSFLVHSAYSYFVHHQFVTSNVRCSNDIEEEQSLANQSLNMAYKQKALACYIRNAMSLLGYEQDDVLPLLNDTVSDLSQCSRRALRDCQVMKSMYNLLDTVYLYTTDDVSETSSVLPSTTVDIR